MTAVVYDIQRPGCRLRPEILKDTAEIRQVLTTTGIVAEEFVDLSLVVKRVFEKIPERDHVFAIVAISLLPAQKQYLNIIVRSWSCRKGPCKFIVEVVFEFLQMGIFIFLWGAFEDITIDISRASHCCHRISIDITVSATCCIVWKHCFLMSVPSG